MHELRARGVGRAKGIRGWGEQQVDREGARGGQLRLQSARVTHLSQFELSLDPFALLSGQPACRRHQQQTREI